MRLGRQVIRVVHYLSKLRLPAVTRYYTFRAADLTIDLLPLGDERLQARVTLIMAMLALAFVISVTNITGHLTTLTHVLSAAVAERAA